MNVPTWGLLFPPEQDACLELSRAGWKLIFLNAEQNETLVALSDVIIPATDTPGAKATLANRFIDLVLPAVLPQARQDFLESLAWFDSAATARYKARFPNLTDEEKQEFLSLVAWPHTHPRWGATDPEFVGYVHTVVHP